MSCKQQKKRSKQQSGVEEVTSFTQEHFTDPSGLHGSAVVIQKERADQINNCVKYTFTDSGM